MSIPLCLRNPRDVNATFDQIVIERATSLGGSYASVSTEDVDTTTRSDISPGYTNYVDSAGDTDKYYRIKYSNSSNSAATTYSEEFRGGYELLDSIFREKFRDNKSDDYFFDDDQVAQMRNEAIDSLWPHTWMRTKDETLTTDGTTEVFTVPVGVLRIEEIEFIDSNDTVVWRPRKWKHVGNNIIFPSPPGSGHTMRLYVHKRFTKYGETPWEYDSYLLDVMMLKAYEALQSDRSKYYKYNSVVKAEGGNLPGLRLIIDSLNVTIDNKTKKLKRTRPASGIGV